MVWLKEKSPPTRRGVSYSLSYFTITVTEIFHLVQILPWNSPFWGRLSSSSLLAFSFSYLPSNGSLPVFVCLFVSLKDNKTNGEKRTWLLPARKLASSAAAVVTYEVKRYWSWLEWKNGHFNCSAANYSNTFANTNMSVASDDILRSSANIPEMQPGKTPQYNT